MNEMSKSIGTKTLQFGNSKTFPIPIVGGNTFGRYPKISNSRTYNMIISDDSLVPFAGYKISATISMSGMGRELYYSPTYNHLIAVVNDGVYAIDQSNSVQRIGSLNTSTGNVFIAENNASQIAIADGLNIYIFDYSTSAGRFTVPPIDFLPASICFHETYFIAADRTRNQWRLSNSNDGNVWPADSSHVGQIETKPTTAVSVVPLENTTQIFVFGKTLVESWYNTGAQLFPYQRNNYFAIDYGCISPETIATGFGYIVWLGLNEKSGISIMYTTGGDPQRISDDGMDYLFERIKNPNNSFGFLMRLSGHVLYQITFLDDNLTFLYDFNTKQFFSLTDQNMDRHIAKRVAFFNGKYYFVSFIDGNLYEMNSDEYTYNGYQIPRYRTINNLKFPTSEMFIVQNITLTMESGIDVSSNTYKSLPPNLSTSRVDISTSNDGGNSFTSPYPVDLPLIGQRKNLVQFWNLGAQSNDTTFRFGFWGYGRFVVNGGMASVYR